MNWLKQDTKHLKEKEKGKYGYIPTRRKWNSKVSELLGKIDFKVKKIDFRGDLKKHFMDSPCNEIMFDSLGRNNNYDWKIWLQNIIKQKCKWKEKWGNPSSSRKDLSCLFSTWYTKVKKIS